MMATSKEVAKLAGVSRATVSRYINGTGYVGRRARESIEEAVKLLNYRPNRVAQSLNTKTSSSIALMVADISNPITAVYSKAIEEVAFERNYNLHLCNTGFELEKEIRYTHMLLDKQVDGVIIAPSGKGTAHFQTLAANGIPFVYLTRNLPEVPADSVCFDNVDGGRKAVDHLLSLGYRRVAAICRDIDRSEHGNRLDGYLLALDNNRLPRLEELVMYGGADAESGYAAMAQLMVRDAPPDAVYTATNMQAAGVIRYCKERGLSIPDDVAIASFESFSEMDCIVDPPLSANVMPVRESALIAASLLFKRIAGDDSPPKEIKLTGTFVIRRSSVGA
ncbi:MAG: LacI family transcriptional regulator [Planctomycetaceae bacterium]|nr:LacI family transcriptional regulator [Planctomycetaceae bacterium]